MRDFYANSSRMPLDQADGLRRMFAGRRRNVMPLAANPHVPFSGVVLDRLAAVLAASGREVLVVDAAGTSPLPHELAEVYLAACVERIAPHVSYLPARGLPMSYVDTRGSAAGFIDAVQLAAPQVEVMLLHADATDLARLLKHSAVRPVLLGADHPESIKHAYASMKLLAQRCGLMTFDLLLTAPAHSPRLASIPASLGGCAENFLGAMLRRSALIDPAGDRGEPASTELTRLLAEQLALEDGAAVPAAMPARGLPQWHAAQAQQTPNRPAYP
jgi:flagellar biosynthesis protein FlhG